MFFDCETEALALDDCILWDKNIPGTECAGPRVGRTSEGTVFCEKHMNSDNGL